MNVPTRVRLELLVELHGGLPPRRVDLLGVAHVLGHEAPLQLLYERRPGRAVTLAMQDVPGQPPLQQRQPLRRLVQEEPQLADQRLEAIPFRVPAAPRLRARRHLQVDVAEPAEHVAELEDIVHVHQGVRERDTHDEALGGLADRADARGPIVGYVLGPGHTHAAEPLVLDHLPVAWPDERDAVLGDVVEVAGAGRSPLLQLDPELHRAELERGVALGAVLVHGPLTAFDFAQIADRRRRLVLHVALAWGS